MGSGASKIEINRSLHDAARQLRDESRQSQQPKDDGVFAHFTTALSVTAEAVSDPALDNASGKSTRAASEAAARATTRQYSKDKSAAFSPISNRAYANISAKRASSEGKLLPVTGSARERRFQQQIATSPEPDAEVQPAADTSPVRLKRGRGRPRKKKRTTAASVIEEAIRMRTSPSNRASKSLSEQLGVSNGALRRSMRHSHVGDAPLQALSTVRDRPEARPKLTRRTVSGVPVPLPNAKSVRGDGGARPDRDDGILADAPAPLDNTRYLKTKLVGRRKQAPRAVDEQDFQPESRSVNPDPEAAESSKRAGAVDDKIDPADSDGDGEAADDEESAKTTTPTTDSDTAKAKPKAPFWYCQWDALRSASSDGKQLLEEYQCEFEQAKRLCKMSMDLQAHLRELDAPSLSPTSEEGRSVLTHVGKIEAFLDHIKQPQTAEYSRQVYSDIFHCLIPASAILLHAMLDCFGKVFELTHDQLSLAVHITTRIVSLRNIGNSIKRRQRTEQWRSRLSYKVSANIRRVHKAFQEHLSRYKNIASAPEQAKRHAVEKILMGWRTRWLDLHTNRRDAEMHHGRPAPRGQKLQLLRDIPVEEVEQQPRLWIAEWETNRRQQLQRAHAIATPAQPEEVELDANGVPMERADCLRERTTPVPRARTLHRRTASVPAIGGGGDDDDDDKGNAISGSPPQQGDAAVSIPHPDSMSWDSDPWTGDETQALLHRLKTYTGPRERMWKRVIWDLCESRVNDRTGGYVDGVLHRFNVSQIVERGVWLRDFLWTLYGHPEVGEKREGEAVEEWEWVRMVWDPRERPATEGVLGGGDEL
ncbi:rRNA 2'-O-methyltransferase fibrillarin [Sphaceloma murrayae]|uniref:rRNA 2'-O-methyltransferase fibrillarin n=1 Tax=Sphaceloma murrayae TaxID=2082308 RepID=A0A2K1R3Q3_9PEZI|nr:rRNA 2'-O-methyltransferase fibrillarin [Sphaceloma murrayae]